MLISDGNVIDLLKFSTPFQLRILQWKPCWSVIFLLRKNGVIHHLENIDSPIALNLPTPVVVTANSLYSGFESLRDISSLINRERTTSLSFTKTFDTILMEYLKVSLIDVFEELRISRSDDVKELYACSKYWVALSNHTYSKFLNALNVHPQRHGDAVPVGQDLISRLDSVYFILNDILQVQTTNNDSGECLFSRKSLMQLLCRDDINANGQQAYLDMIDLIKEDSNSHSLDNVAMLSEAVLFGHLIEAMNYTPTAELLHAKYPSLVTFTKQILSNYFTDISFGSQLPSFNAETLNNFMDGNQTLLQNSFLAHQIQNQSTDFWSTFTARDNIASGSMCMCIGIENTVSGILDEPTVVLSIPRDIKLEESSSLFECCRDLVHYIRPPSLLEEQHPVTTSSQQQIVSVEGLVFTSVIVSFFGKFAIDCLIP